MAEEGAKQITLKDGRCFPLDEIDKFKQLVERNASLINSADPDNKQRGYGNVNDEGRNCSWHVQDDPSQVAATLSTLWSQLIVFARSIDLESLNDEEDDGGMTHKEYDQTIEYIKRGTVPYENYPSTRPRHSVEFNWTRKCKDYKLADDRVTLMKNGAIVLKRGEVANALSNVHKLIGHYKTRDMARTGLPSIMFSKGMVQKYEDLTSSCTCGYEPVANERDLKARVVHIPSSKREIVFSCGSLAMRTSGKNDLSSKTAPSKGQFSLTEDDYRNELTKARSSNSSKFRIADDGRTLRTPSGEIVLKDDETMHVLMQVHELCCHPNSKEMLKLCSDHFFVQRSDAACRALSKKCNFCRCKNNIGSIVSSSPVNVQNVKLDIKVHYDEGAFGRRFEITPHGVDKKAVENYVKSAIDILKERGKWKEPVFSPEASLARSILRVADLLRGDQKEEIEDIDEFDPIQNDTVSKDKEPTTDSMDVTMTESDAESAAESNENEELSEDEEEEKMGDEEEEESDLEDDETREMRRKIEERDRESEALEKEASRFADATGRMRAYARQWEFSDYLLGQIRMQENPDNSSLEEEGGKDGSEKSEESEEGEAVEEVKEEGEKKGDDSMESNKENTGEGPEKQNAGGEGLSKKEKKRLANRKKNAAKKNKKKTALEQPPYDLPPYKANYEEKKDSHPNTTNTVQMERVESEQKEKMVPQPQLPLTREGIPARKRGRLAQMRKEKEELERNTEKEEKKKVVPVYNPYAAVFNGNMWPEEEMEKIRKRREEREKRKEEGLTESEEESDEE